MRRLDLLAVRTATLAALAALALAAGCRRGAPPVEVGSVRVAESALAGPLGEAGLDAAALEKATREALARAGFRTGAGAGARQARVDVLSVRLAPGATGPRVEVTVEIDLGAGEDGKSGGSAREAGTGSAPLAGAPPAEAWGAALRAAAGRAAEALALGFAEEAKPLDAVVADLGSPDARARERAVRVLGERKSLEAVPALLGRLRDPDPEVVHRTVGALAQIRDPRAVGPLIDVSRRGDPAFTARLARLIGDIGGSEARGYLLTLEAGHGDPGVRRAAREALEEMRAAAAAPPAVAAGK